MVSIDRVYQTVLTLLNKEQRGFLTPEEFNLFAQQAQVEIFESYFFELGRATAQYGEMTSEYSSIADNIFEKLEDFETSMSITPSTTEGSEGTFNLPSNLYRLKTLITNTGYDITESSHMDIGYIIRSPLTAPVVKQPLYVRTGNSIQIYPTTGISGVIVHFIEGLPSDLPRWRGAVMGGQLIASTTMGDIVDFVLHSSEEPELVAKILQYAGVHVKADDVVTNAQVIDQRIQQNEQ